MNPFIAAIVVISLVIGIAIGLTLLKKGEGKNPPCDPKYPECVNVKRSRIPPQRSRFPGRRRGAGTHQNENPNFRD